MKLLFVFKQKKNVDTFLPAIRLLVERGHRVALGVQEWNPERDDTYRTAVSSPLFSVVRCPTQRTDHWAHVAGLLRSLRDCVHYQQPALKNAAKLQARTIRKLREELRLPVDNVAAAGWLREIPAQQTRRLESICELAEAQLPSDPLHDQFLREQAPDLLLLSPLVHFGSAQADLVTSARSLGIPVGMLLYSWDNLSTKGCLHRVPDRMFVWNDEQRQEAQALHEFPQDRVTVVGAPRFDGFFDLRPRLSRAEFHEPLGLDPAQPTFLYVCSSQLVSAAELGFVRKWIQTMRESAHVPLRTCNVIVRPHPDIPLLDPSVPVEETRWPALRGAKGFSSRPFDDPHAVVLRTSDGAQQGFYECIHHSAGVVGLNTTAELEAAIVGRPVYTIMAGGEDADGQSGTLHFHYLLEERGGCVRVARDLAEHTDQLNAGLTRPVDDAAIRRFAGVFLRPHGIERPVAPLLAQAIERALEQDACSRVDAHQPLESTVGPSPEPRIDLVIEPGTRTNVTTLSMAKRGQVIDIRVSGTPGGEPPRIDKRTVEWMRQCVGIGEVVYDIDAGLGIHAVIAARYHGAVVVAFEPGYAAYQALCENVRMNGCDGSVLPMPLAVTDGEGLAELRFPSGMPGESQHGVRRIEWRVRKASGDDSTVRQPVCATTLDDALGRYGLPLPNHLRLGPSASASGIFAGAVHVLGIESLKTILFTSPVEQVDALTAQLATRRWTIERQVELPRGRVHVQLQREPVAAAQATSL
jgi:FkbM family methyltransferase